MADLSWHRDPQCRQQMRQAHCRPDSPAYAGKVGALQGGLNPGLAPVLFQCRRRANDAAQRRSLGMIDGEPLCCQLWGLLLGLVELVLFEFMLQRMGAEQIKS
ncbi:hypothetical protein NDU88_007823 [Pleurodeles waltl]|uniref:Uncharacterized protein n=1 Tax=Pleurodeles waltl TaxID=8319 RepID=A0AAV7P1W8_PLEWA|nr:hypothetical protein NDU88_007823 [Pleurodeles waltl]